MGSLLQCTTEEKISSARVEIGDPILCRITRFTVYGQQVLPYGSYLSGTFDEYKDPGHLVGKGWMVLQFDRIVLPHGASGAMVPVQTKVVDVPQFLVDKQGRIHGRGHAVRDIIAWSIPILWPIDLLNLPRRGPRPALRAETNIIVKLMDDLQLPLLPSQQEPAPQPAPYQPPVVLQQRPQTQRYVYPHPSTPFYYSPAIVDWRPRYYPGTFSQQGRVGIGYLGMASGYFSRGNYRR
jgi:hypothetical protein